ncbi:hypothetical protein N2601_12690 [Rhizobium sp. CB3060]|uniref:hypothetical protein n=1 Tax=Rhizobium sp. CB3060 TaxID=3138255 RepID=UPI0021A75DFF|nr:hypothetical protein [Rhizobium tropici]UWU20153.1 hypothetical protein N2601_12690 [Rhizobium tropici]
MTDVVETIAYVSVAKPTADAKPTVDTKRTADAKPVPLDPDAFMDYLLEEDAVIMEHLAK